MKNSNFFLTGAMSCTLGNSCNHGITSSVCLLRLILGSLGVYIPGNTSSYGPDFRGKGVNPPYTLALKLPCRRVISRTLTRYPELNRNKSITSAGELERAEHCPPITKKWTRGSYGSLCLASVSFSVCTRWVRCRPAPEWSLGC